MNQIFVQKKRKRKKDLPSLIRTVSQQWENSGRDSEEESGLDGARERQAGASGPTREARFREGVWNATQEAGTSPLRPVSAHT